MIFELACCNLGCVPSDVRRINCKNFVFHCVLGILYAWIVVGSVVGVGKLKFG
jgi:hypothetical protein